MKRLLVVLCLWAFPASADMNLSWSYAADPLVCDQSSSCDVSVVITRETSSGQDENWSTREICRTGLSLTVPQEFTWTPLNRSGSDLCTSSQVLTAANPVSLPLTIGRITDPGVASEGNYELGISFVPPNVSTVMEPSPLTLTVNVDQVTTGDHVIRIPMNEGTGTTAADEKLLQDATLVGADWGTGNITGRLDFDGVDDRATMGTLDFNSAGFTVSLWFQSDNIGNCSSRDCRLISKAISTSTSGHWVMFSLIENGVTQESSLRARIKIDGTTETVQGDTADPVIDGVLYHGALTYDGSEIKMYLQGQEITLTTSGAFSGSVSQDNTVETWIGANPPGNKFFDGTIDDVRIWNRALPAEEIAAVFGEGLVNSPPPDVPPAAVDDSCNVVEESSFDCNVLGNDTLGSPVATLNSVSDVTGFTGTTEIVSGKIRIAHTSGAGPGSFTYEIGSTAGTSEGTVNVTVVPSGQVDFDTLCAQPGVLMCEDYEVDLGALTFNNRTTGTYKPVVDFTNSAFEGSGSLLMYMNGAAGSDLTGTISYDFGPVTSGTVFVAMHMKFGDGLLAKQQSWDWGESGGAGLALKHFGISAGPSCDASEVYVSGRDVQAKDSSVLTGYHTCGGFPYENAANSDYQGVEGESAPYDGCTFSYLNGQFVAASNVDDPPCYLMSDDTWHEVELMVDIDTPRVKIWQDGNVIVDLPGARQGLSGPNTAFADGPFIRLWMNHYITGYVGGENGGLTPCAIDGTGCGDGIWRTWYDNVIVSTNCIHNC